MPVKLRVNRGIKELVTNLKENCELLFKDGTDECPPNLAITYIEYCVSVAPHEKRLIYVKSQHTLEDIKSIHLRRAFAEIIDEQAKKWGVDFDVNDPCILNGGVKNEGKAIC